jgi:putative transposase
MDRDENAAINILRRGISTVGHTGTWLLDSLNASGDESSTVLNSGLMQQVLPVKEESPSL